MKLILYVVLTVMSLQCIGQLTFTKEELQTLARHNLERKECQEQSVISQQLIDTLTLKNEVLKEQVDIQDSIIRNYININANLNDIFNIQESQINLLEKANKENTKTIKKQNRKITFWRIFTPITLTGSFILGILI